MRTKLRSTVFGSMILALGGLTAGGALAEGAKLGDLLNQGYQIAAVTAIDESIAKRIGGDSWKDDVMITLQRGNEVAICHFLLSATITASDGGFRDGTCQVLK